MYAAILAPGIAASGIPNEFSPRIEAIDPATVVLDITGMQRLLGSPEAIARAIAARAGPHASIAVAPNRNAAIHAVRGYEGIVIIPRGEEAARLGGLPVALLETTPEIHDVLARWGIRTFRDLAALPEAGLADRLGQEGVRLRKLALGDAHAPLRPGTAAHAYVESLDLDDPIELLEPLAFVLSRQLHALCERLAENGLAALELRLTLTLGTRAQHERVLRLPAPVRDPVLLLKLLQLDLQAHPPQAAIHAVTLAAEPAGPRAVQEDLFLPPSPEPEKLELTLRRIVALVGAENVGSPELVDTHRPGAFRLARPLAPPACALAVTASSLAFRVFRPPLAAEVVPAAGPPGHVDARKVRGRVLAAAGPWRSSGDWWTADPWARDDWDLALSDGALYRVYREFFSGRWFVDGAYD